jgi:hypothetical protein
MPFLLAAAHLHAARPLLAAAHLHAGRPLLAQHTMQPDGRPAYSM